MLRAADRYAYRLWKHCLFCRDCLERRDIYILLAFALLCWRRPVSPHRRSPCRFTGDHPVDHAQLARLAPERGLCATESSVGRERLVGLSHNTADEDLNVTSLPSKVVVHPLTVIRRDHMNYHTAELPECLRCLLVVRSLCHIAYYAIVSSFISPSSFLSD